MPQSRSRVYWRCPKFRKRLRRRSRLRRSGSDTVLIVLLPEGAALLTERTLIVLLLLPVHLAGRRAYLAAADGGRLVWGFDERVGGVHHRVVNELPLVVGLLLVVDADGRILAQAGHTDDGTTAKLRL